MKINRFLSKKQRQEILTGIIEAEKQTSGEIRVHLELKCPGEAIERARQVFGNLKMHETERRNGVLIYLAVSDRKLAIYGDRGINEVVPEKYWENIKNNMLVYFRKNDFSEGIIKGVDLIGNELKKHFPSDRNDINELPDELSVNDK